MEEKKKNPGSELPAQKEGLTTDEIMKRHLEDEHDEITDEDIKNVKVDLDVKDKIKEKEILPGDGLNKKGGDPLTPWDVLKD